MSRAATTPFLIVAVVAVVVLGLGKGPQPAVTSHIVASSSGFLYTLDELRTAAEAIVVVQATGNDKVHWNNARNARWESELPGRVLIYNDQEVRVISTFKGDIGPLLTVRNIGGTVGSTRYQLEGLEPIQRGVDYLAFLKMFETPTESGFEEAISFVGQGQGLFKASGDLFVSSSGLIVDPKDLRS